MKRASYPPSLCHRARVWHSWSETGRVYRQSQLLQLQSVGSGGDGGSQQTLTAPHNTTHFLLQILQTQCLLCPLQQSSASLVPHSWCLVVGVRWFFVMSCVVDCWVSRSRFFCRLWSRQVSHLPCSPSVTVMNTLSEVIADFTFRGS